MSLREIEAASIRSFVQGCADKGYLSGKVLDFGAGRQPYRSIVEDAGGEYVPYDKTRFPANVSTENLGPTSLGDGEWDCLLVNQVDQYVMDIAGLFERFFCILRPRGHLVMTGPINWPVVEQSDLRRMTPEGVRDVASHAGFRVEDVSVRAEVVIEGERFPIGWAMTAVRSPNLIYALLDPTTRAVRYVGKTTQSPGRRLRQHCKSAYYDRKGHGKQTRLWNWIRSLNSDPVITILERDPMDVDEAERKWIGRYRGEGARLCNMTNGGDGQKRGYTHSAAEVARRRAYKPTPETVAKIVAANTGKKRDPEFSGVMREIALNRPRLVSDEDVAAIRDSTDRVVVIAARYGISTSYVYMLRRGTRGAR